jgi:hypothetical protein
VFVCPFITENDGAHDRTFASLRGSLLSPLAPWSDASMDKSYTGTTIEVIQPQKINVRSTSIVIHCTIRVSINQSLLHKMSFVSTPLCRVVTLTTLVLVTLLSDEQRMVFAEQAKTTNIKEKMDALTLVKADNKPIESLDALRSGVYSIGLAQGVRSGCGGGSSPGDQGMELYHTLIVSIFLNYSCTLYLFGD